MIKFYKRLKIFYVVAALFLCITLILTSIYNAINSNWMLVFLTLLVFILMSTIAALILHYYRNVVVDVTFEGNNAIIKTNCKVFSLPSENFIEVNDSKSLGRTFIIYVNGVTRMKFIFQKRYSPFKSYSLNIDEMKKHMTKAIFKKS